MVAYNRHFNRAQRAALLVFILLLIPAEIYTVYRVRRPARYPVFAPDSSAMAVLDSLRVEAARNHRPKIYPFNPNYLSGYKAYVLGIDTPGLKRIRAFRAQGKYFKNADEFRRVAGLPDSLYAVLKPYIRIPQFKKPKRKDFGYTKNQTPVVKQDINTATAEELKAVYGIGDKLSVRIVRYRDKLGGFSIREQLKDIYALSPEAYENLWERFEIRTPKPITNKIKLNKADIQQLRRNPYIDFDLAERIVEYRALHGPFERLEDLKKVPGFPVEKYKRIALYLQLD